jgi:hypothetical protein
MLHAKRQQDTENQNQTQELYVQANVGEEKTSMRAILDSGSNCNVMSRRFYTTNIGHLRQLRGKEESATSFNGMPSAVLGSFETDVSLDGTSVSVPFKVIDRIKYDAMLGLDFIEKNVESIDVKRRQLTLSCGTIVPFCARGSAPSEEVLSSAAEPLVVNTLQVRPHRRWFRSRYRVYPTDWRDPKSCAY